MRRKEGGAGSSLTVDLHQYRDDASVVSEDLHSSPSSPLFQAAKSLEELLQSGHLAGFAGSFRHGVRGLPAVLKPAQDSQTEGTHHLERSLKMSFHLRVCFLLEETKARCCSGVSLKWWFAFEDLNLLLLEAVGDYPNPLTFQTTDFGQRAPFAKCTSLSQVDDEGFWILCKTNKGTNIF